MRRYGIKYGLIGRNGVGKSTLLRQISDGTIPLPSNVRRVLANSFNATFVRPQMKFQVVCGAQEIQIAYPRISFQHGLILFEISHQFTDRRPTIEVMCLHVEQEIVTDAQISTVVVSSLAEL